MESLARAANRGSVSTGPYEIANSVLIVGQYSDGQITQTGGDRKKHTISFWHKRTPLGPPFESGAGEENSTTEDLWGTASEGDTLRFNGSRLCFFNEGGTGSSFETTAKFRDRIAWYHFVIAIDTSQNTAADRVNMYVNGELITVFDTETYPSQNAEFKLMQNSQLFSIGAGHGGNNSTNGLGYYAEFIIVDGAQKAATDFGEVDSDSGQWIPKKYTGSFNVGSGTNGGHYEFEGTAEGTGAGSTGLDSSGNSNNINFRNMKGGKTDTPTNNFCTLNPHVDQAVALFDPYDGNTRIVVNANQCLVGTMAVKSGKWYWEGVCTSFTGARYWNWGIIPTDAKQGVSADPMGDVMTGWYSAQNTFHTTTSNTAASVAYDTGYTTYTAGDVWSISLNCDESPYEMTLRINNSIPGTSANNTDRSVGSFIGGDKWVYPANRVPQNGSTNTWINFGNPHISALTGGNADENGYGDFKYSPPSGYYAICTKNIAEFDTPDVDDPSAHFQVDTYTADTTSDTVTFDGHSDIQPDLLWVKSRTTAYNHQLHDSSRGATSGGALYTNLTDAEDSTYHVDSFNSDGYLNDSVNTAIHANGENIVSYAWKANGGTTTAFSAESPATNSQLAGTYQANTASGFSIVTYSGDGGTPRTALHGLGVAPEVIITRRREAAGDWMVMGEHMYYTNPWHSNAMELQSTDNSGGSKNVTGGNNPATATKFFIGNAVDVNDNSPATYVSYCFAPKKGFSKFGHYEGNANASGPFIHTGFKPAWIMVKNLDNDGYNWALYDHKRSPYNGETVAEWLWPDLAAAEFTDGDSGIDMDMDIYSNGFKITTARNELNLLSTFFYMAFADKPFVTSGGAAATGR